MNVPRRSTSERYENIGLLLFNQSSAFKLEPQPVCRQRGSMHRGRADRQSPVKRHGQLSVTIAEARPSTWLSTTRP